MGLLLVHAAATLAMVGLIWFVQVVHYPLFELASERCFLTFSSEHQRRTSWVVVPLMLIEAGSSVALLWALPGGVGVALPALGVGILAVVWLSTFFVQVPLHGRLARERDLAVVRRLVRSNWIRTAGWTARGWIALALMAEVFAAR